MKSPIMLLLIFFISSCVKANDTSVEDIFISPYQLLTDGEFFHERNIATSGYICIFSLNSFLFPTKVDCDNFLESSGILIDLPYEVYSKKEKFGDRDYVKVYGLFYYNIPASPELSFGRILKATIEPITIEEVFLNKFQSNQLTEFTKLFLESVCSGNKEMVIDMTVILP